MYLRRASQQGRIIRMVGVLDVGGFLQRNDRTITGVLFLASIKRVIHSRVIPTPLATSDGQLSRGFLRAAAPRVSSKATADNNRHSERTSLTKRCLLLLPFLFVLLLLFLFFFFPFVLLACAYVRR